MLRMCYCLKGYKAMYVADMLWIDGKGYEGFIYIIGLLVYLRSPDLTAQLNHRV